jgi:hypothetical protein
VATVATVAAAVGYGVRADLHYVSKPPIAGELGFYGVFALVGVGGFFAAAVAAQPVARPAASRWGWAAAGATLLSATGFGIQTLFDHVHVPPLVSQVEFYGLFVGCGLAALVLGAAAVAAGKRRADLTMRFGFVALSYVLLVQLVQSLWD